MNKIKNKTFQTQALNELAQKKRAVWLIPAFCFLAYMMYAFTSIDTVKESFGNGTFFNTLLATIIMSLIVSIIFSVVPFFILQGRLNTKRERLIRESSFISVSDFEYYRDKLDGISPATMSLLTDLQIEQKKDVAASILQYQNWGILMADEAGKYHVTDKYQTCSHLRASDTYLIQGLVDGTFQIDTDTKWKDMVLKEAMQEGYIAGGNPFFKKKKNTGSLLVLLLWLIFLLLFMLSYDTVMPILERADALTPAEQIDYTAQHPIIILYGIGIMALFIYTFGIFIYPFTRAFSSIATASSEKKIRRTDSGNVMAECIYGMKNFIRDFSNLSQADKEQVVLWEDYLVYAVVLEENQKIVNHITALRNELLHR